MDIPNNYWFTLKQRGCFLNILGKNFSPYIIYLSGQNDLPKTKSITANISNNHKKICTNLVFISDFDSFNIFIFKKKKLLDEVYKH